MNQQYTPNIGEIPDGTARRDAIHVAVAPVIASQILRAGEHVGLNADGKAYHVGPTKNGSIGIVDPFVLHPIHMDEGFWLFLYPGTITGLRHLWTHPAFAIKPPTKEKNHDP